MPRLERLPYELWVDILTRLSCWHLASACLVSHRMRNIALPILYKEPDITTGNIYPSPLHLFLRTLLTQGGDILAGHVGRLHIKWKMDHLRYDDPDGPLFSAALTSIGRPDRCPSECLQLWLLLHVLPELRILSLFPPVARCEFFTFVDDLDRMQPGESLPIGLQSLRDFTCWFRMHDTHSRGKVLFRLLNLPSIQSIDLPLPRGICLNPETTILAAGLTSGVKSLAFRGARASGAALTCVLRIPRALTEFNYEARGFVTSFNFANVGLALRQQHTTLVSLVLDYHRLQRKGNNRQATSIGSLRDWPALRSLKSSLLPLLGCCPSPAPGLVDVLPRGLRDLEILDDDYSTIEQAVEQVVLLLQQKDAVVSRLEVVAVYRSDENGAGLREQLRAAAGAARVQLDETSWA